MPFLRIAVAALLALVMGAAHAQTASFTLVDQTNLTPGTYQIYVAGFSTAGPYVLNNDGTWITPAAPAPGDTATIPCWRFPQDITKLQINGAQTSISARVYYFVVTDKTLFPSCNPTAGNTGLFNATDGFTYTTTSPLNLSTPPVSVVTGKTFPAWTFSEIGASALNGTIDLSQVDFVAFPMNSTSSVIGNVVPDNPSTIGNPIGAANPADVVNHASVRDSYSAYINAVSVAGNGHSCANGGPPTVCVYLDLLQDVTTPGSSVDEYVIQNPGGYLGENNATTQKSGLNTVFDGVIKSLWTTTSPPTLTLNTGGTLGSVPQDTFTSSIVTMNFPGSSYSVTAMKFTGTAASGGYVAYIFSPIDYQTGCGSGQIPAAYCSSPASSGYQVFAGAGVLGPPSSPDIFNDLLASGSLSANAATNGVASYNAVVGRLGLLISGAMNRGVALVSCSQAYTWQCWQNETYWYPTSTSATYPDITQNLFSRWIHTATIGGQPMFVQPPSPVNTASSTPGGGSPMGMAYGFADDENPTPPATSPPQSEVPSKFDQTVVYGGPGPYTITFGPWVTPPAQNPTLTVTATGSGVVTSSPAGVMCEPTCSHAYSPGTKVILTAQPADGWIFSSWSGGACSGGSTTCTVTLNDTTTVTATFTAAPPTQKGLHVVVNGPGSVASAPAGIDCGSTCSAPFDTGTPVTLTATPASGSLFLGWTGACAGTGATCVVTMSEAQTAGASFGTPLSYVLSVTGGTGGTVTSTQAGIDCDALCTAGYPAGALVSLIADPEPGYLFAGWTGACSGTQTCNLTMDGNKSVQASFVAVAPGQYSLTVHDFGLGSITSSPPGIACGTSCSAAFADGTKVSLVASPAPGYQFAGWSGACTGMGSCVIDMRGIAAVNARFSAIVPPPQPAEAIPTLSEWALMLLALLMVGIAGYASRRARHDLSPTRTTRRRRE